MVVDDFSMKSDIINKDAIGQGVYVMTGN